MKYVFFYRVFLVSTGLLATGSVLALPPAPAGPYQSVEDGFVRVNSMPQVRQELPQATTAQQQAQPSSSWHWGTPSIGIEHEAAPANRTSQDNYRPGPIQSHRWNESRGVSR